MTLEQVEKQIMYWNKVNELLLNPVKEGDDIGTIVYKKYLELENVNLVMKYVNDRGYRVKSKETGKPIVYKSTDISKVLTDKGINVNKELKEIVQSLYKMSNKRHKKMQ